MENLKENKPDNNDEINLLVIFQIFKKYWTYLLSKWKLILVVAFVGAVLGLTFSIISKPEYKAHLSFSLLEKSSSGGLIDIASSLGFSAFSGGSNGAFSGDNLIEIIKSRTTIESTLLTPVVYKGKNMNLVEVYIDYNNMRSEWMKNENSPDLQHLSYPIGQLRRNFTRAQDSILNQIYGIISDPKSLSVVRKDKKIGIVNIDFTTQNEFFSKVFTEKLISTTYQFYRETKTAQNMANIRMMQHTADSVKNLYDHALMKGAGYSAVDVNPALQFAAVPRIKQEQNVQLYGTVYAEVLKNLEGLKLDMMRETPIMQIIDTPKYPLLKNRLGKAKGIVFGGFIFGVICVAFLIAKFHFADTLKKIQENE